MPIKPNKRGYDIGISRGRRDRKSYRAPLGKVGDNVQRCEVLLSQIEARALRVAIDSSNTQGLRRGRTRLSVTSA